MLARVFRQSNSTLLKGTKAAGASRLLNVHEYVSMDVSEKILAQFLVFIVTLLL
jgi:hypothetical protein